MAASRQKGSGSCCPPALRCFPPALTPRLHTPCTAGRAEPIRLALVAMGIEYEEQAVDYGEMKSALEKYPFAQCPR